MEQASATACHFIVKDVGLDRMLVSIEFWCYVRDEVCRFDCIFMESKLFRIYKSVMHQ